MKNLSSWLRAGSYLDDLVFLCCQVLSSLSTDVLFASLLFSIYIPDFSLSYYLLSGRHAGLMVSTLVSRSSSPGWSSGRGHCVVFLGNTLYSHSAHLHPGVEMGTSDLNAGKTLEWTNIPSREE